MAFFFKEERLFSKREIFLILLFLQTFSAVCPIMSQSSSESSRDYIVPVNELPDFIESNGLVLAEDLMDWTKSINGTKPKLYRLENGNILFYQIPYPEAYLFHSEDAYKTSMAKAAKQQAEASWINGMITDTAEFLNELDHYLSKLSNYLKLDKADLQFTDDAVIMVQEAVGQFNRNKEHGDFIAFEEPTAYASLVRYIGEVIYLRLGQQWSFSFRNWDGTFFPDGIKNRLIGGGSYLWASEIIHELVENPQEPNLLRIVHEAVGN